jgi:hypothetical protein
MIAKSIFAAPGVQLTPDSERIRETSIQLRIRSGYIMAVGSEQVSAGMKGVANFSNLSPHDSN